VSVWWWLFGPRGMSWTWGDRDGWRWHPVNERSWTNPSQLPFALWTIGPHRDDQGKVYWSWRSTDPSVWVSVVAS